MNYYYHRQKNKIHIAQNFQNSKNVNFTIYVQNRIIHISEMAQDELMCESCLLYPALLYEKMFKITTTMRFEGCTSVKIYSVVFLITMICNVAGLLSICHRNLHHPSSVLKTEQLCCSVT
jgi:hypothetical protein